MLKHVSYRSTASLNRGGPDFSSCRGSSTTSQEKFSYKGDLPRTPDLPLKAPLRRFSVKEDPADSSEETPRGRTLPTKRELDDLSLSNFKSPDSVSLTSAFSFVSLASGRFSASRCSSTLSLSDPSAIPVKVYLRRLRPDMEYKTLPLSSATTCRELINSLLTKFRLRHRDPNLFFVLMEVTVRSPSDSTPVKRLLVLDDESRPAELQQCRPKGEARFSIGVRRGGLVRVHDSILMQGSQYKSLLVSYDTTADQLVKLLLECYSSPENPRHYSIHEVCKVPYKDRPLKGDECPLVVQADWPKINRPNWAFVLRRNINYTLNLKAKLCWRRSLDQSSTDTESEIEDHDTTRASIMSTVSSASNSSSSSGVSTDSLDSSSSGVSSGDSCLSSPSVTPLKLNVLPVPRTQTDLSPKTSTPISKSSDPPSNSSSSQPPPLPCRGSSKPEVTPVRPPKAVPRTLFPSLSNLSIKKETSVDSGTEDCAISSPTACSPSLSLIKPETPRDKSHSISFGSFSHSSPKQANIRSLSKSFMNLSLISPISNSKSKSYFNISSPPPSKSTNSPLIKVRSLTLSQKNLSLRDSPLCPSSKATSKSEFNLSDKSCLRHCENCFYI